MSYIDKILALQGKLAAGAYDVAVCHDDWCDFYNHRGECNCEPDIRVVELGDDLKPIGNRAARRRRKRKKAAE